VVIAARSARAALCTPRIRSFGYEGERPALTGTGCASVHGFSLHANVAVLAHRRDQLARLIRSTARGAVSLERLEADEGGDLLCTFTRPWSDGTIGITLAPLALLEKLAALVPLPRMPLVRSGGCLAPPSQRFFRRPLGRSGVRCARCASRGPRVASTSPREPSYGPDGVGFRVKRVGFRVRWVGFAPARGVRATGGRHAKCALKNLYASS
jgi:hypothetical protein